MINLLDKLVGWVAPKRAYQNALYRTALRSVNELGYSQARRTRIQVQKSGLGGSGDRHADKGNLWTLREYSRALDRDNVIASAMLDRGIEAIVGTGINLQVESGDKIWDTEAESLWHEWWDTEADIRNLHMGHQLEALAYRAWKVDGDVLFVLTELGKVQAIEADRIQTPSDAKATENIINGVEQDIYGRPVAFWVANYSFSETKQSNYTTQAPKKYMQRIDAQNAVFLAGMNRLSQSRGVPVFATNLQLFDDIDAFIETCILHAKIATSHVMFIEREGGAQGIDGVETAQDSYDNDRQEQVVSPGMMLYGKPGERATMVGSTQSMVQFGPFVQQLLRFTGLNFGMPLEMLSLDFSKTNYSSARAALLVAHRSFLVQHKTMTRKFLEPILRWKMREWVRDGLIQERKFRVTATPPKALQVDPMKEMNAEVIKVQNGYSTNRDVCSALGSDWENILTQRAEEIRLAIERASELSASGAVVDWRELVGGTVPSMTMDPESEQEDAEEIPADPE